MCFDLKRDLDKTLELMESNKYMLMSDERYAKPYFRSTVNHRFIFDNYDGRFDSFLGIIGSFNPELDAIYKGAKNIVCFDKSIPVVYYAYLVLAVFLGLTYEEMLDYLFFKQFDEDLYGKVRYSLPSNNEIDARKYFDVLYDYKGSMELKNHFGFVDYLGKIREVCPAVDYKKSRDALLSWSNSYDYIYEKKAFYELKEKLKEAKIKIMQADIYEVPDLVKEKFTYIYLSCANLFLYERYSNPSAAFLANYPSLLARYKEMLCDNGAMLAGYDYSHSKNLDEFAFMRYYFRCCNFDILTNDKDLAYVYRKK